MYSTVENDFSISQGTVATSDRRGGQAVRFSCQIFSGFRTPKIIKIGSNWRERGGEGKGGGLLIRGAGLLLRGGRKEKGRTRKVRGSEFPQDNVSRIQYTRRDVIDCLRRYGRTAEAADTAMHVLARLVGVEFNAPLDTT